MSIKMKCRFVKEYKQDDQPIIDTKTGRQYGSRNKNRLIQLLNDMDARIEALEHEIEDLELEMAEECSRRDI